CLPPRFLTPELQRFLLIVHVVHSRDVVDFPLKQDTEPVRCHLRCPFTETDGKSNVRIRNRQSGRGLFLPALPTDCGMTGIIILPDIPAVSDIVRSYRIFLEG